MGFEPNISSFDPEPSGNVLFELPGGVPAEVIVSKTSFIKTLIKSPANRKYINLFMPIWSEDTLTLDSGTPAGALFLIAREMVTIDDTFMYDYISIEEEEVNINLLPSGETYIDEDGIERSDISKRFLTISYGPKEAERLISLYGNGVPQLQVTLDEDPLGSVAETTNSIKGEELSYDSLSSLDPISEESLTLSVVSDAEGTVIERREATITDVGGPTTATGARNNRDVDLSIRRRAESRGVDYTTTTITSGY